MIDVHRLDLVVENQVVVGLKAVDQRHPRCEAQLPSYRKASDLPVGLPVNFGESSLHIVRRVHQKGGAIRGSSE
jgi:GxxExxY protein